MRRQLKVAYGGVFPSVGVDGQQLVGVRASRAGQKLAGGPYALTSIRLGVGINIKTHYVL